MVPDTSAATVVEEPAPLLKWMPVSSGTPAVAYSGDFLRMHPSRDLYSILSLLPDVSVVNGGLHIRGSRDKETGFRFNGISVWNRYYGDMDVPFIPEAIEVMTVHTGIYGADMGSANGGIVDIRMREGGETFEFDAKYITDDVQRVGHQTFGTSSFGFNTVVATMGGPLPFGGNFFAAGEVKRMRDREPRYVEPLAFDFVTEDIPGQTPGVPLPWRFELLRNHVPNHDLERKSIQSHFVFPWAGVSLTGSSMESRGPNADFDDVIRRYYNGQRIADKKDRSTHFSARWEINLFEDLRIGTSFGWSDRYQYLSDPVFGDNWRLFSDSAVNAARGFTGFTRKYLGPSSYSTVFLFYFSHQYAPETYFQKERQTSYKASLNMDLSLAPRYSLSIAALWEWWAVRKFRVHPSSYLDYYDDDYNAGWGYYHTGVDERAQVLDYTGMTTIGYDIHGRQTDEGFDRPRRPSFGSIGVTLKIDEGRFRAEAGLQGVTNRLDIPVAGTTEGALAPFMREIIFDYNRDLVDESALTVSPVEWFLLPRFAVGYEGDGWSVDLGARWSAQTPFMSNKYLGVSSLSWLVNPLRRTPYNLGGIASPQTIRSERSRHIELTSEGRIFDDVSVSFRVYHKSLFRQLELGHVSEWDGGSPYVGYVNSGEGSVMGGTLGLRYAPTEGSFVSLSYGLINTNGTSSDPRSNQRYVTDEYNPRYRPQPPVMLYPLDYQQTHRFTLQGLYIFGPSSSLLHGLSLGAWLSLQSGHRYTRELPGYSHSVIWTPGVWSLIDSRSHAGAEPHNASETPWQLQTDVTVTYEVDILFTQVRIWLSVLNLFDRKNEVNVFPKTGVTSTDGWLEYAWSEHLRNRAGYEELYRGLILKNRWAYSSATGNDLFGPPRQVRLGVEISL